VKRELWGEMASCNRSGGKAEEALPESPFPSWLSYGLVSPVRRLLVDRRRLIEEAGIREGSVVLELGCGPGFFTEEISRAVGESGLVYAQDVQSDMLNRLERRLKGLETKANIRLLLQSSASISLPPASIDVVFAANVFEEIEAEGLLEQTVSELYRLCRNGAVLFFLEHRCGVSASLVKRIYGCLESGGFTLLYAENGLLSYKAKFRKP